MIPQLQNSPRQRLKTLCVQQKKIWMGIINLSPNSFSTYHTSQSQITRISNSTFDKSNHTDLFSAVLYQAESFIKNGASILDIGATPSNPFICNALVNPSQEIEHLVPILYELKKKFGDVILISVDTYSPTVAYTLAKEGLLDIVNDIYGGRKIEEIIIDIDTHQAVTHIDDNQTIIDINDDQTITNIHTSQTKRNITLIDVVAEFSLGYILMHMSGQLDTLPTQNDCTDIPSYLMKMLTFFQERKETLSQKGIDFCVFDPGIGGGRFGKNLDLNLAILSKEFLTKLKEFGFPIMVGLSRKGFLGEFYPDCTTPLSRDGVSKEWEQRCFQHGVSIIRTHIL